jgi:hypothetical protein
MAIICWINIACCFCRHPHGPGCVVTDDNGPTSAPLRNLFNWHVRWFTTELRRPRKDPGPRPWGADCSALRHILLFAAALLSWFVVPRLLGGFIVC